MQAHTANVDAFDRTLRHLGQAAPQIDITAVHHLGDVLEIHLAEPTKPPAGITALNPKRWSAPLTTETNHPDPNPDQPPPAPALAFLGSTDTEALAVNLIHARPGIIHAQHTCPVRLLRALSLDLVRAPWSRHVTLHLVGFGNRLAHTRPGQVTSRGLDDTLQQLTGQQTAPPHSPHILLCAQPVEPAAAARKLWRLLERSPWLGALILTPSSHSTPPTIPGRLGRVQVHVDHGTVTLNGRSWHGQLRGMSSTDANNAVAALPARTGTTGALDLETTSISSRPIPPAGPRLHILGAVTLTGVDPGRIETGRLHAAAELAAYLHLHPAATANDVVRALWPHASNPTQTCASTVSRLRRLLGQNNPTKRPDGTYHLELDSDLDDFRAIVRRARTRTIEGETDDLTNAVELLRGPPLHDPRAPHRYQWATHAQHELIAEIIYTVARLVHHHLHLGRPRLAYTTARKHLHLHPTTPELWHPMLHALAAFAPNQLPGALDRYTTECTRQHQPVHTTIINLARDLIHNKPPE